MRTHPLNNLWTLLRNSLTLLLLASSLHAQQITIQFAAGFNEIEAWNDVGVVQKKYELGTISRAVQAGDRYMWDYRVFFPPSSDVKEIREVRQYKRLPDTILFTQTSWKRIQVYGIGTDGIPLTSENNLEFRLSTSSGLTGHVGRGAAIEVSNHQKRVHRGDMLFEVNALNADDNHRVFWTFIYLKDNAWVYVKLRKIVKAGAHEFYRPTMEEVSEAAGTDVPYFLYGGHRIENIGMGIE